jgi:hypothetical protein
MLPGFPIQVTLHHTFLMKVDLERKAQLEREIQELRNKCDRYDSECRRLQEEEEAARNEGHQCDVDKVFSF